MGDQPCIPVGRQVIFPYPSVNHNEYDLIPGIVKVNDHFLSFGLLALFISRFALHGCLQQVLARLRTSRSAGASTSPCLSRTSFYYPSCSQDCCAFTAVLVVFLTYRNSIGNRWALPVLVGRDVVISLHLTFLRVLFISQLPPPQNSLKR